jgi:hypothetical protein
LISVNGGKRHLRSMSFNTLRFALWPVCAATGSANKGKGRPLERAGAGR